MNISRSFPVIVEVSAEGPVNPSFELPDGRPTDLYEGLYHQATHPALDRLELGLPITTSPADDRDALAHNEGALFRSNRSGSYRLYQARPGEELAQPVGAEANQAFALLHDGRLVTLQEGKLHLEDKGLQLGRIRPEQLAAGEAVYLGGPDGIHRFEPDSRSLERLSDEAAQHLTLQGDRLAYLGFQGIMEIADEGPELVAAGSPLLCHDLSYSPDGSRLLLTSGDWSPDGSLYQTQVHVVDRETGLYHRIPAPDRVMAITPK